LDNEIQLIQQQTVAVADDALDTEMVDRRHLRRDVIVLKVLRHLRKTTAENN